MLSPWKPELASLKEKTTPAGSPDCCGGALKKVTAASKACPFGPNPGPVTTPMNEPLATVLSAGQA